MIEYTYNLYELPSSQHRAGLAGLILLHRWMKEEGILSGTVEIDYESTRSTVKMDDEGLESLLNGVFGAFIGEMKSRTPLKKLELIREETKEISGRNVKLHVYPQVYPKGAFLEPWCGATWLSLWRSMVWKIIRGIPAARVPFKDRAAGVKKPKDVALYTKIFNKPDGVTALSGSYSLGIAAKNSENVPFKSRNDEMFLLLFWPFVVDLHIPTETDPSTGKVKRNGFLISVPDVSDLRAFCGDFPRIAKSRMQEKNTDLYIEILQEGGASYVSEFERKSKSGRIHHSVFAADLFHAEKVGNSVKIFSVERFEPTDASKMLVSFIRQARKAFWVSFIRQHILKNLLAGRAPLDGLFKVLYAKGYHSLVEIRYMDHDVRLLLEDLSKEEAQIAQAASVHVDFLLRRGKIPTFTQAKASGSLDQYLRDLRKKCQGFFSLCSHKKGHEAEFLISTLSPHLPDDFDTEIIQDNPKRALTIVILAVLLRSTAKPHIQ